MEIDLKDIIQDTSIDGGYVKFYEKLQLELSRYSDERIESMRETIKFVYPNQINKIDDYDKMKVIYEYSLLP